jgi:hypothetical protein
LDVILDTLNTDSMGDINLLYNTILRITYSEKSDPWVSERFRRVIGSIVVLRKPLCIADTRNLLELRRTPTSASVDVKHLVRRLRTVLVSGTQAIDGQTVPRLHKSFFEFITSERPDPRFRVDRNISNELASQCLRQLGSLCNRYDRMSGKGPMVEAVASLSVPLQYALQFSFSHLPQAAAVMASNIGLPELRKLLRTSLSHGHTQSLVVTFFLFL